MLTAAVPSGLVLDAIDREVGANDPEEPETKGDREAVTLLEQLARLRLRLAVAGRAIYGAGEVAIPMVDRPDVNQAALRRLFQCLEESRRALERTLPIASVESIAGACRQAATGEDLPH